MINAGIPLFMGLIIFNFIAISTYYQKLNAKEKKQFYKECLIIGLVSAILWGALLYGIFNVTGIGALYLGTFTSIGFTILYLA